VRNFDWLPFTPPLWSPSPVLHIRTLDNDRYYLERMVGEVASTMEDALHDGWYRLNPETAAWLYSGLGAIKEANRVQTRCEEDDQSQQTSHILFCPCETVSRRILNTEVIVTIDDISKLSKDKGMVYSKKEILYADVASKRGPSDPQCTCEQVIIRSFCNAQGRRDLDARIRELLELPNSLFVGRSLPSQGEDQTNNSLRKKQQEEELRLYYLTKQVELIKEILRWMQEERKAQEVITIIYFLICAKV
jgi:hypothetical protein